MPRRAAFITRSRSLRARAAALKITRRPSDNPAHRGEEGVRAARRGEVKCIIGENRARARARDR